MENICVAEASTSSDPSCDERVSEISSLVQVTSTHMAATSRPCDPRDFKKSRAYQFKALDQNVFQLDRKVTQERSTFALDRSILTPITDGDQVNDIKMTTSSTDECDVLVSEAVVDLAIDNSVDMSMPEVVDMVLESMDVDDSKKEDSMTEGNRKEDSLARIEGVTEEQNTKAEDIAQSSAVLEDKVVRTEDTVVVVQDTMEAENRKEDTVMVVEDKMEVEDRKQNTMVIVEDKTEAESRKDSTIVMVEDKMEAEDRKQSTVVMVEDTMEAEDRKQNTVVMVEDKTEAEDGKDNTVVMVEDKMEAEDGKDNTVVMVEDKMETENRKKNTVGMVEDKTEAEDRKNNTVAMVDDKMEAEENIKEDSTILLEDKTEAEEKESVVEVEKEKGEAEAVEDREENNVVVEARVEDDVAKDENKDDKIEVDKVKEKDDKMEVEEPLTEQFKTVEHMDTTLNVNSSNKFPLANSALTGSKIRVKNELFCFNPEPIDDDLSLPSCNELSNQVLSNNLLRDIENLSDSVDSQLPIGPSISRVLSKPLIPSCSAFRSSVLSDVTSTVRSGSSLSVSGRKQNLKGTTFTKPPRKGSSPRKVASKTSEKSVSKKLVSKRNSESSSEGEKAATTAVETKPVKPKPVFEQVRKYSTRRAALLEETKQVEKRPQPKPAPSAQEKLPVRDTKSSPHKHTNLQSSSHIDKSLSKPPQLDIKTSKQNRSPSKTPTKSPSKTTPTRTLPTRQSAKQKLSPCTSSSSTSPSTKSHAKTIAKATVSSSDPIPAWITWKCCLCSRGSSQDQLGFLYGPYKSQTDDCVSVGSKRTHDDTDSDSDEKQTVSELWVHEGCACWAPGVCLVGSELHGLAEAVKNAKDMECVGCHQPGATISCSNRGCKASFHYPCAIKAGCSLLPDQLLLLCQTHDTQEKTV